MRRTIFAFTGLALFSSTAQAAYAPGATYEDFSETLAARFPRVGGDGPLTANLWAKEPGKAKIMVDEIGIGSGTTHVQDYATPSVYDAGTILEVRAVSTANNTVMVGRLAGIMEAQ